jgi:hypothetical protein
MWELFDLTKTRSINIATLPQPPPFYVILQPSYPEGARGEAKLGSKNKGSNAWTKVIELHAINSKRTLFAHLTQGINNRPDKWKVQRCVGKSQICISNLREYLPVHHIKHTARWYYYISVCKLTCYFRKHVMSEQVDRHTSTSTPKNGIQHIIYAPKKFKDQMGSNIKFHRPVTLSILFAGLFQYKS